MLQGSPSRRVAAVLMTVLVAVLLVPFGGSARTTHHRTTAGPGHVASASPVARAAHAVPTVHDVHLLHLDASTPPADALEHPARVTFAAASSGVARLDHDVAAPTGRGPPAA